MQAATPFVVARHGVFHPLSVQSVERLTEDAVAITFAVPDDLRDSYAYAAGQHLTLNVSGAIPAVMLDLDFPLHSLKTVPLLARTAGILAHLVEERERPIGSHIAHLIETTAGYDGPVASAR